MSTLGSDRAPYLMTWENSTMRSSLTHVALAATLAFPLLTHSAAAQPGTRQDRPMHPHLAVENVLRHQEHLALDAVQVSRLSELARRLQASPVRLRMTGSDRVPGKAAPRVERTRITYREALERAFGVLTPAQRKEAARLIASERGKN
jgi:hypothetical protein